MAVAENGSVDTWDIGTQWTEAGRIKIMMYFKPHLKWVNYTATEYMDDFKDGLKTLDGSIALDHSPDKNANLKLQNGMVVFFVGGSDRIIYSVVDVNGKLPPNTLGKDTFIFTSKGDKMVPEGTKEFSIFGDRRLKCNMKTKNNQDNGKTCAHWVIYKGNMDYLHRDVSAEW